MKELDPQLKSQFERFREIYLSVERRLTDEGASAALIAQETYRVAMLAVPLTAAELKLYKMLVAIHSVNGGKLFEAPTFNPS